MPKNFSSISGDDLQNTSIDNSVVENLVANREQLKHLLIGSPRIVRSTIHRLHGLGYVAVRDWSPLQPTTNPNQVMSILVRYVLVK
ncbi:MAG: hypothetical protein HC786_28155 [Richelia sp. CSU_2_1]|nr:hypothetical protein [Microcoleus sp. SU_5_6]NJL67216.1 hypothetical protein [Microcoleus sp. SM1_3_4]NJR25713.1 hypothetical protein [Richelia sp. CSU_2_1]